MLIVGCAVNCRGKEKSIVDVSTSVVGGLRSLYKVTILTVSHTLAGGRVSVSTVCLINTRKVFVSVSQKTDQRAS